VVIISSPAPSNWAARSASVAWYLRPGSWLWSVRHRPWADTAGTPTSTEMFTWKSSCGGEAWKSGPALL